MHAVSNNVFSVRFKDRTFRFSEQLRDILFVNINYYCITDILYLFTKGTPLRNVEKTFNIIYMCLHSWVTISLLIFTKIVNSLFRVR
jgi:hypothetical protein